MLELNDFVQGAYFNTLYKFEVFDILFKTAISMNYMHLSFMTLSPLLSDLSLETNDLK